LWERTVDRCTLSSFLNVQPGVAAPGRPLAHIAGIKGALRE